MVSVTEQLRNRRTAELNKVANEKADSEKPNGIFALMNIHERPEAGQQGLERP